MGGDADNYSREAAAKAFDHLISQGLVAYADARWGLLGVLLAEELQQLQGCSRCDAMLLACWAGWAPVRLR